MKCKNCGFENKSSAKYCTSCGAELEEVPPEPPAGSDKSNNTKYIIAVLVVVILVLVGCLGYFMGSANTDNVQGNDAPSQNDTSQSVSSDEVSSDDDAHTQSVSSQSTQTSSSKSKSWESIGSYSGSGSGSQTIDVPAGEIMVKLSAYPIKNYATNHLYVTGSNGQSGGVDWGSHSDVETRSDSFTYSSSSSETFTIDYYETVSWQVEFYRYQ